MKSTKEPLISVGIPTYNNPNGLERTLNCITNQTYKNVEIIISDNNSPGDATLKIIQKFRRKDKRIRFYQQKINRGPFFNFRFVAMKAKGEFFMWASDDDRWYPRFIVCLKKVLGSNPKCGVAMSSLERRYEDGSILDEILFVQGNNLTNLKDLKKSRQKVHGKKIHTYVYNLTNLNNLALFRKMIHGAKIHIFIYGLFQSKLLKKLLRRPFPNCVPSDRVFMSEVALATKFCTVPEILHTRIAYRKRIIDRHKDNEVGKNIVSRTNKIRYIATMINRLFTSPLIPLSRKVIMVPDLFVFAITHPFNKPVRRLFVRLIRIVAKLINLIKKFTK